MAEIPTSAVEELTDLGGMLRCEVCLRVKPLGDLGNYMQFGWPRCHHLTMRWWTARQIKAGEHNV